jgi:hypothetical protein
MSYHGKLQVLKNGTADKEIQLWAYQQLEKELTLTDEEIEEVAKPYCDLQNWVVDKHEFARAILRKASEK